MNRIAVETAQCLLLAVLVTVLAVAPLAIRAGAL